jgi:hypothetical protein
MARKPPRSVRAETNLSRAPGLWATGPTQLTLPFDASGLGVAVRASGRLSLTPDLDLLAWVCDRWATTRLPDGYTVDGEPHPDGVAAFTLYDLGLDLYGREPGGEERRAMRESLLRLFRVEVTFTGYDAAMKRPDAALCSMSRLITTIVSEREALGPAADAQAIGALRGSTWKVELASWLRRQLLAGNVTYLDWRILRQLDGAAKRTWVYLEAERWKPAGDGLLATHVGLGRPALDSLGVGGFQRHRDARRALERAGARIVAADERYASVTVEGRPGGHALVAYRLDAERLKVRRQARASLGL